MPDSSISTLKEVAGQFGTSQKHARNSIDGITEIVGSSKPNESHHQVISQIEFFPHTDGHYLNGIRRDKGDRFLRVTAPHLILLQCVEPAQIGGTSLLVDGQKILQTIIQREPKLLKPLFARNVTGVLRGDHLVMDIPIFQQLAHRRYAIRFSYDRDFLFVPEVRNAFARFNENYILNPAYSWHSRLEKNEICIIDNQRLLHGRTAFQGQRILRRLWLFDSIHSTPMVSPQNRIYFETDGLPSDPLSKFAAYAPQQVEQPVSSMTPAVKTGIRLNAALNEQLQEHLRRH
jgi:hypothetical protein